MDPELEKVKRRLRAELSRRGLPWRTSIWKDLVHSRVVELVLGGHAEIAKLADLYARKYDDYYPPRSPRGDVVREVEDRSARSQALTELLLAELTGVCGVDAFRDVVLGGKLLRAEEVPDWIEAQAAREGPVAGRYAIVPLPPRTLADWTSGRLDRYAALLRRLAERAEADPASELPRFEIVSPLRLEYPLPGGGLHTVPVRSGGALAGLKSITSGPLGLCRLGGWSEPGAVGFVLTGRPPTPLRYGGVLRYGLWPSADRITLTVSANATLKELAAAYQDMRKLRCSERGLTERGAAERAMDAKHLALARCAGEGRSQGSSWKELRQRWNAEHPAWRFPVRKDPHARRFAHEARRCWSRVSGQAWDDLRDLRRDARRGG